MGARYHWKRTGLCLLLAFLLGCALVWPAAAAEETEEAEHRTVRVAFPEQVGMSFIGHTGNVTGYNYDYLEKISEYTGWRMEYVPYPNADGTTAVGNALQDLKDGKVDLIGPLLKNDVTEALYEFPENSYGTVYTTLCAQSSSSLRESNLKNKRDLKVGLWKKAETRNQEVLDFLDADHFSYEITYFDAYDDQLQALRDGAIDVMPSVSLSPITNTRIVAQFAERPYYFAATKGNKELVQELDKTIAILDRVQPNLQDALHDLYFRDAENVFSPTDSQKKELIRMGELNVLCIDDDGPYVYQNEADEPAGMLLALLDDFAQEVGLPIHYTFCQDREEAEKRIPQGDYDLLVGIPLTSSYCAQTGFVKSEPIMASNLAYVQNPRNPKRDTIAVVKGLEGLLDLSAYPNVVTYDTAQECLAAVEHGDADLAAGDRSVMEYYIYDTYSSLTTSVLPGQTQNICVAVDRGSDEVFLEILNEYISSLSSQSKALYLSDANAHSASSALGHYVRTHPVQATVLVIAVTLFFAVCVFLALYAKKMNQKNAELAIATQAKSDFLTRMSHDIRTPMNGILGMLEIADRHAEDPEAVRKYHKKIHEASEYLLSLLNDVLDMSSLESQTGPLKEESVDLWQVEESCQDILMNRAAEQGVTLTIDPETAQSFRPPRILTNERYLRQVFMNVIGNAIKYNKPHGSVTVSGTIVEQTEDALTCRFAVADTGIGMSESFQKKMFEPFVQEHGGARGQYNGTGLGLSIVKRILDQMGGTVQVDSTPGEGTTITWTLTFLLDKDYTPASDQKADDPNALTLTGKRILTAEDNDLNAEILLFLLQDAGAEVKLVSNGQQLVDAFAASPEGHYDYILTDIMMPILDGYEACHEIRTMDRPDAQSVPIIALTANAFAEDAAKASSAGMDAHITKPCDLAKLQRCLGELERKKP